MILSENSLTRLFLETSRRMEEEIALLGTGFTSKGEGGLTWGEWRNASIELAAGWLKNGLKKGEVVLVDLSHSIEWPVVHLSILLAGGITVPVKGVGSGGSEVSEHHEFFQRIFQRVGARFAVTGWGPAMQKLAENNPSDVGNVKGVYYIKGAVDGVSARIPDGWKRISYSLTSLRELGRAQLELYPDCVVTAQSGVGADDPFLILFTPGTEGRSRGVILDQGNLYHSCTSVSAGLEGHRRGRQLIAMDSHTIWGVLALWIGIHEGHAMKLMSSSRLEPGTFDDWPVDIVLGTPKTFASILELTGHENIARSLLAKTLSSWARKKLAEKRAKSLVGLIPNGLAGGIVRRQLKRVFGGGNARLVCAGLPPGEELARVYREAGFPLQNGYGLTETSGFTNLNSLKTATAETAGRPVKGVKVKLSPRGEIMVKGRSVFRKYLDEDESTKNAFTEDGFFKTGDIGMIEEDGTLVVLGRKDHIFETSNGHPVSPLTIEAELESRKEIKHAVVVGNKRPYLTVLLELDRNGFDEPGPKEENSVFSAEVIADNPELMRLMQEKVKRLIASINAKLPRPERIRAFGIVDSVMPEGRESGALGKPKRDVVLRTHQKLIDELYSRKPTLR